MTPELSDCHCLSHHYRAGFEWFDGDIEKGEAMLKRMLEAASCSHGPDL